MTQFSTGVWVSAAMVALAAPFPGPVSAQTIPPEEVRVTNSPYIPKPAIRLETQLVQLEVVVRDARGRAVCGLAKEDFEVYDSGKSRDLSAFSVEASNPAGTNAAQPGTAAPPGAVQFPPDFDPSRNRWVALVFDDINTGTGELARVKIAARRFVEQAAASGDRVGVFTTSGGEVLEFTGNVAAILAAIARVESHPRASPGGQVPCPRITPYEAYEIVMGNTMVLQAKVAEACNCSGGPGCAGQSPAAPTPGIGSGRGPAGGMPATVVVAVQAQAKQTWEQTRAASEATLAAIQRSLDRLRDSPGKRMLLVASSGFLSGTLEDELDDIIDEAVRAGVVINSLDAKGLYAETPGPPIGEPVEVSKLPTSSVIAQVESLGDRLDSVDSAMARFAESTGGLLFRNNNDLDLGFGQIGLVPACVYLMGFPPAEDGKYHKLKIKLRNKSRNFLQARPGYFARGKPFPRRPEPVDPLDAAVTGSEERSDLQVASSETPGNTGAHGRQLAIHTRVDLHDVSLRTEGERRVQQITLVAALFSAEGKWVTGTESVMDLALKPESYERFLKTGITGTMSLEAPAGAYRLRVVVQEAVDGKMSATSKDVRIPQS